MLQLIAATGRLSPSSYLALEAVVPSGLEEWHGRVPPHWGGGGFQGRSAIGKEEAASPSRVRFFPVKAKESNSDRCLRKTTKEEKSSFSHFLIFSFSHFLIFSFSHFLIFSLLLYTSEFVASRTPQSNFAVGDGLWPASPLLSFENAVIEKGKKKICWRK